MGVSDVAPLTSGSMGGSLVQPKMLVTLSSCRFYCGFLPQTLSYFFMYLFFRVVRCQNGHTFHTQNSFIHYSPDLHQRCELAAVLAFSAGSFVIFCFGGAVKLHWMGSKWSNKLMFFNV